MLSYRHAFHAGNHADVFKHIVLIALLDNFNRKDKPWCYIDTHAGAGVYRLNAGYATQNTEHATGVAALQHMTNADLPPLVQRYWDVLKRFNTQNVITLYPGSPLIAAQCMRSTDKLRAMELHSSDYKLLQGQLRRRYRDAAERVTVNRTDGFIGLKSLLPPSERRGLILMDPSYEDKRDYARVPVALRESLLRFATGCYAVWHPQLARAEAYRLPERLRKLNVRWLHARLTVRRTTTQSFGMSGSGMFIINPPWTLEADLQATLPWLCQVLGQDAAAGFSVDVSTEPHVHAAANVKD